MVPQFSFQLKTSKQTNKKELEIPEILTKGEEDDLSSFSVAGKVAEKKKLRKIRNPALSPGSWMPGTVKADPS